MDALRSRKEAGCLEGSQSNLYVKWNSFGRLLADFRTLEHGCLELATPLAKSGGGSSQEGLLGESRPSAYLANAACNICITSKLP